MCEHGLKKVLTFPCWDFGWEACIIILVPSNKDLNIMAFRPSFFVKWCISTALIPSGNNCEFSEENFSIATSCGQNNVKGLWWVVMELTTCSQRLFCFNCWRNTWQPDASTIGKICSKGSEKIHWKQFIKGEKNKMKVSKKIKNTFFADSN